MNVIEPASSLTVTSSTVSAAVSVLVIVPVAPSVTSTKPGVTVLVFGWTLLKARSNVSSPSTIVSSLMAIVIVRVSPASPSKLNVPEGTPDGSKSASSVVPLVTA